jgi:hypothetical protein
LGHPCPPVRAQNAHSSFLAAGALLAPFSSLLAAPWGLTGSVGLWGPRGFAFVSLQRPHDTSVVIERLDGRVLYERPLRVRRAENRARVR